MKHNYKEFKALDEKVDALFEEQKYDDAVALLERSYDQFPQYNFELTVYALYCCRESKDYDKCLALLDEGLDKGYFYGLGWSGWDPMKGYSQWDGILKRNEKNREKVQKDTRMEYKVFLPENYDKEKSYPMLIALHGDGNACNIEYFSKDWKPDGLTGKDWIVAYVQSSHGECTGGFGWTYDYGKSRSEIKEAYDLICREYSVDRRKVLVGGFSGGSMASLNLMMNDAFPMKGIVALCPNETDDCTEDNIKKAAERGTAMVLLEGEKSGEVAFHKELMTLAGKHNMRAEYIINKNAGHIVPRDFDMILEKAVEFLMG